MVPQPFYFPYFNIRNLFYVLDLAWVLQCFGGGSKFDCIFSELTFLIFCLMVVFQHGIANFSSWLLFNLHWIDLIDHFVFVALYCMHLFQRRPLNLSGISGYAVAHNIFCQWCIGWLFLPCGDISGPSYHQPRFFRVLMNVASFSSL